MTELLNPVHDAPEVPGAPYDLEFFLDPICPFAWQTSVWIRRVAGLPDFAELKRSKRPPLDLPALRR